MTAPALSHPAIKPFDYDLAKSMAQSDDPAIRRSLATRNDVQPELLYFLAADRAAEVRKEIAANAATPRKADLLLARDVDPGVRTGLARKIARLAPNLPRERLDQIERVTIEILETLARDQTTEVRRILADELQSVATAPPTVIAVLARDVELSVCGPVLRNSPILTDEDLLEIIFGGVAQGALSAIAERAKIGTSIADAIAESDDPVAITRLLSNPSAQIREETLDRIIERAPQHEPWHAPLVRRPHLPARAAARLATFVADALLGVLQARTDLGPDAARQVADSVRDRLTRRQQPGTGTPPSPQPPLTAIAAFDPPWAAEEDKVAKEAREGSENKSDNDLALERAKRLQAGGRLTEKTITSALADGDRAFVVAALSLLIGTEVASVDQVLASHSGRAVVALVWRAGLSMGLAQQIQLRLAQIPPKEVIKARAGGTAYPFSEADMVWQLEFFSIP